MSQFSAVFEAIAKLCAAQPRLNSLMQEYQEALKENKYLCDYADQLRPHVEVLEFDQELLRGATKAMDEQRSERAVAKDMADSCYVDMLKLKHLLSHKKFDNILKYTVMRKQTELQEKLKTAEEEQKVEAAQLAAMEDRHRVREFRLSQRQLQAAKRELVSIEQEKQQVTEQTQMKVSHATQQRDRKIVSLAEKRKELADLQAELKRLKLGDTSQPQKQPQQAKASIRLAAPSIKPPFPLMKSAAEFIPLAKGTHKKAEAISAPAAKRSILVNRSQEEQGTNCSPTKQVRFDPHLQFYPNEETDEGDGLDDLVERMEASLIDFEQLDTDEVRSSSTSFTQDVFSLASVESDASAAASISGISPPQESEEAISDDSNETNSTNDTEDAVSPTDQTLNFSDPSDDFFLNFGQQMPNQEYDL